MSISTKKQPLFSEPSFSFLRLFQYTDYMLFVMLLMWKVTLFDQYIDLPFAKSLSEYRVSLGSILLLSFWVLLFPRLSRRIVLFCLYAFVNFVIIADLIYYRYFKDLISVPVLLQAGQVGALDESISSLFQKKDVLFFVDFAILLPLGVYMLYRSRKSGMRRSRMTWKTFALRIAGGAVIFGLGYALIASPISAAAKSGIFTGNWWNISLYNATGLIGFHGYDTYRYVRDHMFKDNTVPKEEIDKARQWFNDQQKHLAAAAPFSGAFKNKNVIVIQAEAFQSFVIGQKINGKEVTPNLNALIKESVYFKNFYHMTGQGRTSDAEFSVNCSLHPLPTGSVYIRYPSNEYSCLPRTLKENGYETAAFHAYEPSFWNRYNVYKNIGFDRFFSQKDFVMDEKVGWSVGDTSFFKQSVEKMKQMKKPFFSFLVTLSSHHPYHIQDEYKQLDVGKFEGTMFGDYLHSVHYVDEAVGQLVEHLKAAGLWDDTIVVFYGDHDNSITDQSFYDTFFGRTLSPLEFERMQHQVPLIVHLPKGAGAGEYDQPAGQIDLAPTILQLLGIPADNQYMMGHNIFQQEDKLIAFRNGSFTDGKLFFKFSGDYVFEHSKCYDLSTGGETDLNVCEPKFRQALDELKISDNVIMGNLIKTFKAKPKTS